MSLAQSLWEENADLVRAARGHRFVRGIGDGSLPREDFRGYVAQDAFFLEGFARAYALALARSPDREGVHLFAGLISGVTEELRLHRGYAERWGVALDAVAPVEATLAYTEFLLSTAARGSVGEVCAAMAPCMRLYAFLGHSLAEEGVSEENPYRGWIETYADPKFGGLADRLEEMLDRYALDETAARHAYRRAMTLEVAFFEASAGRSGDPESR